MKKKIKVFYKKYLTYQSESKFATQIVFILGFLIVLPGFSYTQELTDFPDWVLVLFFLALTTVYYIIANIILRKMDENRAIRKQIIAEEKEKNRNG